MGFTREDIQQIKQYAEAVQTKSLGVEIKSQTNLLADENNIVCSTTQVFPDENHLTEQKMAYMREMLFLLVRDFRPISRLYERKMPGRVQTLKDIQQQIQTEMKGRDWVYVDRDENLITIPHCPGDSIDLFVGELLSDVDSEAAELAVEKPAETRQIGCPTSNITTKDIDKLLELFRQLENLLNPELPQRDGQLWVKAMEQSRKELADKLKKRQSGFTLRPGRNNLKRKSIKAGHSKKEDQAERIIRQMAENKYRLWDSKYDQSLSQVEEKIVEVVKRIDHTLYSMKEPLLAFDRTQGTLLQANFRNIRDDFTVNEIRQFQDMVKKSIDALEAIRLKVERQQHLEAPIKNQVSPNKKNAKTNQLTRLFAWLRKHPHSYVLTGGVIFLILFFVLGLFKAQWRNWCWGVAGLAFLVLILSLLGGRSRQ